MWDLSRHCKIVERQGSDRNVLTRLTQEETTGRFSGLIYVAQAFLKGREGNSCQEHTMLARAKDEILGLDWELGFRTLLKLEIITARQRFQATMVALPKAHDLHAAGYENKNIGMCVKYPID